MNKLLRVIALFAAVGCSAGAAAVDHDGPPHGMRMEMAGPPGHGPGGDHGFGPMRGDGPRLTEAQEDKLFAIMHAQEPQRREHERAARKAREGLRELAAADKFDEARAASLAQAEGKAVAALSLLRARTDAQVAAILTPEQRQQFKARGPRGDGPRPDARP